MTDLSTMIDISAMINLSEMIDLSAMIDLTAMKTLTDENSKWIRLWISLQFVENIVEKKGEMLITRIFFPFFNNVFKQFL